MVIYFYNKLISCFVRFICRFFFTDFLITIKAYSRTVEQAFHSSFSQADIVHVGVVAPAVVQPDAGVESVVPVPRKGVGIFLPTSAGILNADKVFTGSVGIKTQHLKVVQSVVVVPVVLPVVAAEIRWRSRYSRVLFPNSISTLHDGKASVSATSIAIYMNFFTLVLITLCVFVFLYVTKVSGKNHTNE